MTGIIAVITLAAAVFAQIHCKSSLPQEAYLASIPPPSQDVQVIALPVGQGDCTLIQCPNGNIVVVDCGSSGGNGYEAKDIDNFIGDRVCDVVAIFISHPDRDHFNYFYDIDWHGSKMRSVIIGGTILDYEGKSKESVNQLKWLLEWKRKDILYTISDGQACIGNCTVPGGTNFCDNPNVTFDVLSANVGSSSNQKSIVIKLAVGEWSMLLPGDMEGSAATKIARNLTSELSSSVYKIAHHGASSLANKATWLKYIKPTAAFASSAYNFGNTRHPRCKAIARLRKYTTLNMTEEHEFYCGNSQGADPTLNSNYTLNIYETSPAPDKICILTYESSGQQSQQCFKL